MIAFILPQSGRVPGRELIRAGVEPIAVRVFMKRMPVTPQVQSAVRAGMKLPRVSTK